MKSRRIQDLSEWTALRSEWNRWSDTSPFLDMGWLESWWNYFGANHELYVVLVEDDDGEPIGAAPFYRRCSVASGYSLHLIGSGEVCSDYQALLHADGAASMVSDAVAEWLLAAEGADAWHTLDLDGIREGEPTLETLVSRLQSAGCDAVRRGGLRCWRIALPSSWDEYLASLSKSHRKQVRRALRRNGEGDGCRLCTAHDTLSLTRGMEILVDLHQKRRLSMGDPGCFANPRFDGFLHEAAEQLLETGRLEVHWFEIAKRPVAADIHLRTRDTVFAYQSGVDPDILDEEPGRRLQAALIQRSLEEGVVAYDFLRGDEPYKAHWRAQPIETWNARIANRQVAARLRHGVWRARGAVKGWLKNRLSTEDAPAAGGKTPARTEAESKGQAS